MNFRKDIFERVKYIMKEHPEMKVNCSKLARQLNCDRRTVSRYVELSKNGKKPAKRVYQKKTDGFEKIIEEKVKTTAPAIAIYYYTMLHIRSQLRSTLQMVLRKIRHGHRFL